MNPVRQVQADQLVSGYLYLLLHKTLMSVLSVIILYILLQVIMTDLYRNRMKWENCKIQFNRNSELCMKVNRLLDSLVV